MKKGVPKNFANSHSSCNFQEASIASEIGLFHEIRLSYPRTPELHASFLLSGRPILCELDCYVVRIKSPRPACIFKKSVSKIFVFTEEIFEVAFKHFLFTQILQSSGFFSVKLKSFTSIKLFF